MDIQCENRTTFSKTTVPPELLVSGVGKGVAQPVANSRFNQPINFADGNLHGRSRWWGDVSLDVQNKIVQGIVSEAKTQGLNQIETAFILAVSRFESGFNPDAAAQRSSAAGLGQMIDQTAAAYGIQGDNRFSPCANIQAMIRHFKDLKQIVEKRFKDADINQRLAKLYTYYHDGFEKDYGGLKLAEQHVIPWTERFANWLRGC